MRNVVIIGSGCAGNTAAIYTARANLRPLVVGGHEPGGQLSITTLVENYPGFPEGIDGPVLVENMKQQAKNFGAEFMHGSVIEADLLHRPFRLNIEGEWIETRTVVIASGASARWLGLPSEQKLIGRGVSSCATCDGFFFRGKKIMVVGGGDSAMEEANFLTRFGEQVTIAHRRDEFRASKIMQERAFANDKIRFLWNHVVEDVLGSTAVDGVVVRDVLTDEQSTLPVTGLFVAIGHKPNTDLFKGQLEMEDTGYLVTHDGTKTNVEGVFACGDVQDHTYRQAITAAGSGCMAAIDAERWLEANHG
jgi:thioredoxin reductase (NADPH)